MSRETSKQFDLGSQGNSELPFNKMLDELLITSPVSIKHAQTQAHSLDKQHRDKKQDSNLRGQQFLQLELLEVAV